MYTIRINRMRFYSHIGVYQAEKKLGQKIEINLEVKLNIDPATLDDQVAKTVNYADFYATIAQIVKDSRVDLIETLALTIIKEIKKIERTKIATVKVSVKKLGVPIDGILDNVEIEMEQ
ncbi:dihydroneopterin aldolase [Liquorilactobacillus satsumensis]|nr:dihydroneopterin aldolase [Liquorilactobacillus satsumensis]AJA34281.1 dihydroneopterin aldolase [Liquorilactobacillus satsumensis]